MGSVTLANVYRGAFVESLHRGSIAVVDSLGRLVAFAGDPGMTVCIRSSAKPFQAIPLLEYGGIEEFDLSGEEIALICASHGGEPMHVATAAALLRKGELDEEDLLCGAHFPYDDKAAADLRSSGELPSPLHNNCSGKHAGMLLATQAMDVSSDGYIEGHHPIQELARQTLADFAGVGGDAIASATDGCGVPAFFLPLYRAAFAYARLMASSERPEAPGAVERYAESSAHIVGAMTGFPEFVAGNWSMTTPLMNAYGGDLLAKEGGEGFYAMALAPSLARGSSLQLTDGIALGIAVKVEDGSMERGRNSAVLRLLDLIGLGAGSGGELERWRQPAVRNHAGTVVGEVRSEFNLEVL